MHLHRILIATAMFAASTVIASAQTVNVPAPTNKARASLAAQPTYESVKSCLEKVCVTYDGQTACMKEGSHFRSESAQVAGPDNFGTQVVDIRQGLRTHPVWRIAEKDLDACLGKMRKF